MTTSHQDDPRVVRALAASSLLNGIDRVMQAVWHAAGSSNAAGVFQRARDRWSSLTSRTRDLHVSIFICAAVVTHIALTLWQERPAGWLWLMIPASALSIAVLLNLRGAAKE